MFNRKSKRIDELTAYIDELIIKLNTVTAERDHYKRWHVDTVSEKLRTLDEQHGPDRTGQIELCPHCGQDGLYHRIENSIQGSSMQRAHGVEASVLCFFCGYNGGMFTQPVMPELVSAATYNSDKYSPVTLSEGVRMEPIDREAFDKAVLDDMRDSGTLPDGFA